MAWTADGLDGRWSQTSVVLKQYVEDDEAQTQCQDIESVRSALHSKKSVTYASEKSVT